jgi:histidinol phosphatase-like enzyme
MPTREQTATETVHRRADVIEHLVGCPARRTESIEARRPSTGELVRVDRCIDCGSQTSKVVGEAPGGRALTDPERQAAKTP